jgi:hypothetical protein
MPAEFPFGVRTMVLVGRERGVSLPSRRYRASAWVLPTVRGAWRNEGEEPGLRRARTMMCPAPGADAFRRRTRFARLLFSVGPDDDRLGACARRGGPRPPCRLRGDVTPAIPPFCRARAVCFDLYLRRPPRAVWPSCRKVGCVPPTVRGTGRVRELFGLARDSDVVAFLEPVVCISISRCRCVMPPDG